MRSYRQYCAVAKALDVVGDRWNLLIVRELLLRGPCRYVDLLSGLPGIATNLLAERLRDLESAGVVYREEAPPPIATGLFRLTPRGAELRPVLLELVRWGAELMVEPADQDAFRSHWLAAPVALYLADHAPTEPPIEIEVRAGGEDPATIETVNGTVAVRPGPAEHPDLILTGRPRAVLGLLTGRIDLAEAKALGLQSDGDADTLRRVQAETAKHDDEVSAGPFGTSER
jgi:DNA-binding HxlR family transcriptional regulator